MRGLGRPGKPVVAEAAPAVPVDEHAVALQVFGKAEAAEQATRGELETLEARVEALRGSLAEDSAAVISAAHELARWLPPDEREALLVRVSPAWAKMVREREASTAEKVAQAMRQAVKYDDFSFADRLGEPHRSRVREEAQAQRDAAHVSAGRPVQIERPLVVRKGRHVVERADGRGPLPRVPRREEELAASELS